MVHSRKHIVQFSLAAITAGNVATKVIVASVAPEDVDSSLEVVEGSTVKAVYLELWLLGDDALTSTAIVEFEKRPSGHAAPSAAEIAALHDYDNKKNILEQHMGLIPSNTQNPVNVFRHWIKIPKGKQRMGLGDLLSFTILAQSDGIVFCGFATYKEYY